MANKFTRNVGLANESRRIFVVVKTGETSQ